MLKKEWVLHKPQRGPSQARFKETRRNFLLVTLRKLESGRVDLKSHVPVVAKEVTAMKATDISVYNISSQ